MGMKIKNPDIIGMFEMDLTDMLEMQPVFGRLHEKRDRIIANAVFL